MKRKVVAHSRKASMCRADRGDPPHIAVVQVVPRIGKMRLRRCGRDQLAGDERTQHEPKVIEIRRKPAAALGAGRRPVEVSDTRITSAIITP